MLRLGAAFFAAGLATSPGCTEGSGSTSVVLSGRVTEYVPASTDTGTPIDGVVVCQFRSNNCSLTDENGEYDLPLLMNREVLISHVKEGSRGGPWLTAWQKARSA